MHHGQTRCRSPKVGNVGRSKRPYICRLQIRPSKGNAGHPGRDTTTGCEQHILRHCAGEELLLQRVHLQRIALVQKNPKIAFGSKYEQFVRIDTGSPKVPKTVERNAVRPGAFPQAGRAKDLPLPQRSVLMDAQPAYAPAGRLNHVHILFLRIHSNLVRKMEAVGDDMKFAVDVACNVAIGEIGLQGVHPVLDPG